MQARAVKLRAADRAGEAVVLRLRDAIKAGLQLSEPSGHAADGLGPAQACIEADLTEALAVYHRLCMQPSVTSIEEPAPGTAVVAAGPGAGGAIEAGWLTEPRAIGLISSPEEDDEDDEDEKQQQQDHEEEELEPAPTSGGSKEPASEPEQEQEQEPTPTPETWGGSKTAKFGGLRSAMRRGKKGKKKQQDEGEAKQDDDDLESVEDEDPEPEEGPNELTEPPPPPLASEILRSTVPPRALEISLSREGTLGLRFGRLTTPGLTGYRMVVEAITDGSQATDHPGLVAGLVLCAVRSGEETTNIDVTSYKQGMGLLKAASRPVTLSFKAQEPVLTAAVSPMEVELTAAGAVEEPEAEDENVEPEQEQEPEPEQDQQDKVVEQQPGEAAMPVVVSRGCRQLILAISAAIEWQREGLRRQVRPGQCTFRLAIPMAAC